MLADGAALPSPCFGQCGSVCRFPRFSFRRGSFSPCSGPTATQASGAVALIYAGAVILALMVVTLGVWLLRSPQGSQDFSLREAHGGSIKSGWRTDGHPVIRFGKNLLYRTPEWGIRRKPTPTPSKDCIEPSQEKPQIRAQISVCAGIPDYGRTEHATDSK